MARSTISVPLNLWRTYVRLAVVWLTARFIGSGFSAGTYPGHDPNEDRAADFMVPSWQTSAGKTKGTGLANYLANVTTAKRLSIWYVIWFGRIWSMTRPEKGWLPYFARNDPNPSKSHHNHVHVSFYDKAAINPLYGTTPAPTKTPTYGDDDYTPALPWTVYLDRLTVGTKNSDSVWILQKALGIKPRTGTYTDAETAAIKTWQRDVIKDDPKFCDGELGPRQAATLFGEHVEVLATVPK
jgi:hypothetical protein